MRTLIVVQQRMGSTRLPRKAMAKIAGRSVTEHVIRRALATGWPVVLAVPGSDDFSWLKIGHPKCYLFQDTEGEEADVMGRYVRAVAAYVPTAEVIVRLTGDCPFVPVEGIVTAVAALNDPRIDYAQTRSDPSTRPNGIDVQAFTYDLLMRAHESGEDREHLTAALLSEATGIGLASDISGLRLDDLPPVRLTLDTDEDLARYGVMCKNLWVDPRSGHPNLKDIVALYEKRPDLFHLDET